MTISVSFNGENFEQVFYNKEDAFEQLIVQNAETIFGNQAIYIDTKKKVNTSSLGGTIPDGFLIDLSDSDDPQFYLVEIELQSHDFFKHIFPQITRFFAFYRDSKQRHKLIETLFELFQQDSALTKKLKNSIGTNEIYKFLKDTIDSSQNILIVIDGAKSEFEEIINTYTDTWGKMVSIQIVNHFKRNTDNILTVEPPFQNLQFGDAVSPSPDEIIEPSRYTEEFHLDGCETNVRDTYSKLKNEFLSIKGTLRFNPVKYYIGVRDIRNIAAIRFQKRRLLLEALLPENEVNRIVHQHKIKLQSSRGPMIEIEDTENWDEIEALANQLVEKYQNL